MGLKKLVIDLDLCETCSGCSAECSYFYHPNNKGVLTLREVATFSLVCRKCEQGTCVLSCPKDALEKQPSGVVKRYNMRCISCKSCSYACPFGTIYPEVIPYIVAACDFCWDRSKDLLPLCVRSCKVPGALKFEEVKEEQEKGIYKINDNLYAHSTKFWIRV